MKIYISTEYKEAECTPLGFSLNFNKTVALDIKEILGTKVIHLGDHSNRYCVAVKD